MCYTIQNASRCVKTKKTRRVLGHVYLRTRRRGFIVMKTVLSRKYANKSVLSGAFLILLRGIVTCSGTGNNSRWKCDQLLSFFLSLQQWTCHTTHNRTVIQENEHTYFHNNNRSAEHTQKQIFFKLKKKLIVVAQNKYWR